MAKYEKYLSENNMEDLTDDMLVSDMLTPEDLLKLKAIAVRINMPEGLPVLKKVVEKVYKGVTVSADKEKVILMDVLRFFLSPDKTKFRTILSKF
jgi:hypothetical protein